MGINVQEVAKLKIKKFYSKLFTTSNCSKAGQWSIVLKQIAKFIAITLSTENINKCQVSKPI